MKLPLNVVAPINTLSYGYVATQLINGLDSHFDIFVSPIGQTQEDPFLPLTYHNPLGHVAKAPSLRIYHQFDLASHVGHPSVGMPIFELDRLKPIEINHMGHQNLLISCSHWAKGVCAAHGLDSVVVPLGVDRSIFNESVDDQSDRPFTFFNGGKWEIRKGHDLLLAAFSAAFSSRDNVKLSLLCTSPFPHHAAYNSHWINKFLSSKNGNKVEILPRLTSLKDVAALMGKSDCGVFPARAEGWNLELLEMLSVGKPCIAGNYSAPTEYLSSNNCSLLEPTSMVSAKDGVWFDGFGNWADYSLDDLVDLMRLAYRKGRRVNTDGIETAKRFTWENSCDKLARAIGELFERAT